ncbi:hypothetical protein [uncultured Shewanella sp.]|uniref:hypothetical protein n=1 Tax=Shewanella atlantica TaxID=271099 RepID=UPI00263261B1|nr:hypothetical protein [uncultured Shewanella sp.]
MLNLIVLPLMPLVGALTANLNELVRGETLESHPKLTIGMKTFTAAAAGFAMVWFALLVTAIYAGGETDSVAGVEVLLLFLAGLFVYSAIKGSRLLSDKVQLWVYRLAIPFIFVSSFIVMKLG